MLLAIALPVGLSGQSLHLSSTAGGPGDSIAIEVSLTSLNDSAPQVLQWDTTIPIRQLSFLDDEPTPGAAAGASDKFLNCSLKTPGADTRTISCILAGGLKTISDGVVAVLRLRILPEAPAGPARVGAARAVAVLPGLKQVPIPAAEAFVSIRSTSSGRSPKK